MCDFGQPTYDFCNLRNEKYFVCISLSLITEMYWSQIFYGYNLDMFGVI